MTFLQRAILIILSWSVQKGIEIWYQSPMMDHPWIEVGDLWTSLLEHPVLKRPSLPELAQAGILLVVLFHDLGDSHFKVLLGYMDTALTKGKHACLCAASLELSARGRRHHVGNLCQVNAPCQIHLPAT